VIFHPNSSENTAFLTKFATLSEARWNLFSTLKRRARLSLNFIMRTGISFLLVITFSSYQWAAKACSQNAKDTVVEQKILALTGIWKKYNSLSSQELAFSDMSNVTRLFTRTIIPEDTNYYSYLTAFRNASIDATKDDYGLKLNGNISDNFGSPVIADDDIVYRMRVQAGLDWDIFKEGYFSAKIKTQQLENRYIINKLEHQHQTTTDLFVNKYAGVLYLYNEQKIKLLEKRREINVQKLDLARQLNLLKEIPYVQVIEVDQSLTDIDGMFMVYKGYNDLMKDKVDQKEYAKDPFPLLDIDFQQLAAQVMKLETGRQNTDSIIDLKIKNLQLETDPWNTISLRASFKYNYYFIDNNIGSRDYFSLGLGVSMPIPTGKKNDMKVIDAEKKLLQYEAQGTPNQDVYEELMNNLYEYRYKLKQYMNYNEKKIRYRELLRVERVKEQFGDEEFNPLTALNLLDDLLAVNVEMLDIQQQMYLQLLKIGNKYPGMDLTNCVKPFQLPSSLKEEKKMNLSVYAWSAAFDEFSNNYMAEYLVLNHMTNAIISVKRGGANNTRTAALIDTLYQHGITTELMTGNNKLLKQNITPALDSMITGIDLKHVRGIHLDVEPHTQKDYKGNEQKYMQLYVKMVKDAAAFCTTKGIKLYVSIPLFYPEDVLKEIYSVCDRVYLMAYENPEVDFVERKTVEELKLGKEKTVISLRAEDFATRHDMEVFMAKLSAKLGIDRFALHDLSRMVDLDQGQLKNTQKED
jgi:hypothetical protein